MVWRVLYGGYEVEDQLTTAAIEWWVKINVIGDSSPFLLGTLHPPAVVMDQQGRGREVWGCQGGYKCLQNFNILVGRN